LPTLAALQRGADRTRQPSIAAGICLLGVNCESHRGFIIQTLEFADKNTGFQDLLRAAATGLGALGAAGAKTATDALFTAGLPWRDPVRPPIALALGAVALRNTAGMIEVLQHHADQAAAIGLLAEGFDMLEEDLAKERFFTFVRRTYWESPEGSP